ncbi:hypothetical protein [Pseudolabrys sp. Root1462]|uniref:hypothetical protein n=1 Tax=Pseudolabrys sp. Root1462 TaxID=1736466 RepID=UPI000ABA65D3|nr:hypothetical protein [Pseudolabrys sp. Root1462]
MTRFIAAVAMACAFALAIPSADAKPRKARIAHAVAAQCFSTAPGREACPNAAAPVADRRTARVTDANGNGAGEILSGRPAGCPHRFCGCEASLYVFGRIIPKLNLAANWRRVFPRAAPAPGMAAARSGHVFVLIAHVEGRLWLVHDGNSGGGKTRRHVRSIAGYTIVNPNARVAGL